MCAMNKALFSVAAMLLSLALRGEGIDTSVSNEFWCCWGHVNATPSVRASEAGDELVLGSTTVCESSVWDEFLARGWTMNADEAPLHKFNSFPPCGFLLFLR